MVRNLREAMSLSSELATVVSSYAAQTGYTDRRTLLGNLIETWADTSTLQTSIELALENDFNLIYMIPGQEVSDFNKAKFASGRGNGRGELTLTFGDDEKAAQKKALMEQQQQVVRMIAVLEMFNGDQFVDVNEDSVTTGNGETLTAVVVRTTSTPPAGSGRSVIHVFRPKRTFVSLSQQQIDLLTQSYEQLKESVYRNLAMQTHLADYTDEISIEISETASFNLDFSDMNALLETRCTTDPTRAFADLVDLVRYQGISFHN